MSVLANEQITGWFDPQIDNQITERPVKLLRYTIEYTTQFRRQAQTNHYCTEDPVACEEFVEELLEREFVIRAIKL